MRYVITGASRGIGLEFVQQLLRRGDTVDAGVRAPEQALRLEPFHQVAGNRLRIHALDVSDPVSVRNFAADVCFEPVDVLINNAGVPGQWVGLHELDYDDMARTLAVNALGPLRITAALLPALRQGTVRKVAYVSSRMGAVSSNTEGGAYAYRMSKAALNMGVRSVALDLRAEGFSCVLLHPGWVQTDMGGPDAPVVPEVSVRGMLRIIDGLTPEQSGRFFDFEGEEVVW
ncbi:SDR family oxidoreductase [Corallococcus sp. H22C18031201]|uniref:SDR family oxidoreductase n=1 Tax=Citreicoccus inhibens TaxID=2849499 RepID=UPI000E75F13D|nr:SDR family oxidoreductase [Citreicoccus inhibens]MBU8900500.1 SDR family oxidoreductase [Citreicoccus inhibens]RJS16637.1 SDR family oxidoreductase [Corallococcus sp. H22C18031201]